MSRKSCRLKGYDYSKFGAYFLTICSHNRKCLFGDITDGDVLLNDLGRCVDMFWNRIHKHFPAVQLDEYIIMPNHIHGILHVGANDYSPINHSHQTNTPELEPSPRACDKRHSNSGKIRPNGTSLSIGSVVRGFKIGVTKEWRSRGNDIPVWQRNYYDHIIRDEQDLMRIREYIDLNPLNWQFDSNQP